MKLVFFGDSGWAVKALELFRADGHEVLAVVVRKKPSDDLLSKEAERLGLPLLQPDRCNDADFVEKIRAMGPDLNVSVSYDQILRKDIIDSARMGFINVHGGMLPFFRGRSVINWALINGEKEIGVTCHFVDTSIDTGDIITQHAVPIDWTDTYATLLAKVTEAVPVVTAEAVRELEKGNPNIVKQSHLLGSYFPVRRPGDEWLDWSDSSFNLYNKIRGITRPGPGARTTLGSGEVIIWKAEYESDWPGYLGTHGEVVGRKPGAGVYVKTGDSVIFITEIQAADDETSRVPDWKIGVRLGFQSAADLHALFRRMDELEQKVSELQSGLKQ